VSIFNSAMPMNSVTNGHKTMPAYPSTPRPNIERLRHRVSHKHDRFSTSFAVSRPFPEYVRTITPSKGKTSSQPMSRDRIAILFVCLLLMAFGFGYQFMQFMKHASVSTTDLQLINQFLVISAIFFASGFLKGVSGIGMGLIAAPVITLLYSPILAVALVALPLVATNFHQGLIAGDFRKSLQTHMPLAVTMSITMAATSRYAHLISPGSVR